MTQFIPSPEQQAIFDAVLNTTDNVAIAALAGTGKCVHPDTLVAVNGELIPANLAYARYATSEAFDGEGFWAIPSEPLEADSFNSATGVFERRAITALYRQHVKETLRVITLNDGSVIRLTKQHKLFNGFEWTNIFKVGDIVTVPSNLPEGGTSAISPATAELISWLVSEGYDSTDHNSANFSIAQKDPEVLKHIARLLESFEQEHGLKSCQKPIRQHSNRNVWTLRFSGVAIRRTLEMYGYTIGAKSKDERVPFSVMKAPNNIVRVFLSAYFEAEGSVGANNRSVDVSSASPLLIQQVSYLLRRFGIWGRIRTAQKGATNGLNIKRPYYILTITGKSLREFANEIGFMSDRKNTSLSHAIDAPTNANIGQLPSIEIFSELRDATGLGTTILGLPDPTYFSSKQIGRDTYIASVRPKLIELSGRVGDFIGGNQFRATVQITQASSEYLLDTVDELDRLTYQQLEYATIRSISEVPYEGFVYDFTVEGTHNFVAENILCHNTTSLVELSRRLPAGGSRIFCAFNKDIVKELESRLNGTGVTARTFHSLGRGALKKYMGVEEIPEPDTNKYSKLVNKWAETDSVFALSISEALQEYDPEERAEKASSLRSDTLKMFVKLLDLIRVKLVDWDDVSGITSLIAMNQLDVDVPHETLVELVIRNVEHLMKQAEAETRKLVIDFTDMIYWAVKWKLRIYPYKWVLVDEAQDFNPLQREMIAKIIDPKGGRIILVGDINQAIYAFAGADSDSFDLSVKRWNCKVLPLNTTRRCSWIITHHASRLVPDFNCPPDKPRGKIVWLDEKQFSTHVAVGDLVVSRVTAPLVKEFLGLIAKGIPSVILGKDMAEQFTALIEKLSARNDYSFPNLSAVLNTYEAEQITTAVEKGEPATVIESIRDRCAGLRAFIDAYPNMPTLSALTAKIKSLLDTAKPKADAVVFCTVHKSKGLEADRVFILAPDKLPLIMMDMSPEQLQQENNLLYVAETRAKNTLVIVTNEKYRDANTMPSYAQEDFEDKVWDATRLLPATIAPVTDATPTESTETYPSFHAAMTEVLGSIGTDNVLYATNNDRKMWVSYTPKWDSFIVKTIAPDGKQSSEIVTSRNDTLQMMKEFQSQATHWQFLSLAEWEAINPVTPVVDAPKPVVDAVFKPDGLFVEAFTPEPTEPMPKITLVGFAENTSPNFAINVTALLALLPKSSGLFAVDGDTKMYVAPHITEKPMFFVETANGEYTQETLSLKDALAKMEAFSPIVSTWNTITSDDWMFATAQHKTMKERKAEAQSTPLVEASAPLPFASIMKQHLTELLTTYDPDRGLCADGETTTMYITTNWDEEYVIYERDYINEDDMHWSRDSKEKNTESVLKKMEAINANPDAWRIVIWGEWIDGTHNESPADEQESTPVETVIEQPAIVMDESTNPSSDAPVEMIVKLLRIPESPEVLKLAHAIHSASLEHLPNINRETLAGISKLQTSIRNVMREHNYPPPPSGIYMDTVVDDIALFLVNGTLPDTQDTLANMVAEIGGVIVADEPPVDVPVTPSADALLIEMIATCLQHPNPEAGTTLARAIHTAVSPILIRLDWKSRHDVANMRIAIKRVMREHHYPPSDYQLNMNDVVNDLAHLFEHGSLPDAPAPDTRTPFAIAMTPRMRLLVTGSKEGLFCNGDSKTLFIEIAPDESIVINEFVYAGQRNPVAVVNLEPTLSAMESHNPNPDAWQLGEWDTWYKDARTRQDAHEPESTDTTIEAQQPIVSAPPVVAPIPNDKPADTTVAPDAFSIGESPPPHQNGKDTNPTPAPLPSTAPEMLQALIDQFRVFELNELALVQQAIDYIKREKEGVSA